MTKSKSGKAWSALELKKLEGAISAKIPYADLSKTMPGRTAKALQLKASKLGWTRRKLDTSKALPLATESKKPPAGIKVGPRGHRVMQMTRQPSAGAVKREPMGLRRKMYPMTGADFVVQQIMQHKKLSVPSAVPPNSMGRLGTILQDVIRELRDEGYSDVNINVMTGAVRGAKLVSTPFEMVIPPR